MRVVDYRSLSGEWQRSYYSDWVLYLQQISCGRTLIATITTRMFLPFSMDNAILQNIGKSSCSPAKRVLYPSVFALKISNLRGVDVTLLTRRFTPLLCLIIDRENILWVLVSNPRSIRYYEDEIFHWYWPTEHIIIAPIYSCKKTGTAPNIPPTTLLHPL